MLTWDDAAFSRLAKAKKADVWIYSRETVKEAPELYLTNAALENGRKLTNMQAELDPFLWSSGAMLVDFKNDKGERLQASLVLPANYEKGKQYPTMVYIYERAHAGAQQLPASFGAGNRLQHCLLHEQRLRRAPARHQVLRQRSRHVGRVGLVPAVKAAIATGVVDPKHVGLHGHSWGGYQTAFTVTQTDIFAAAVAGAPLTDMISMYSLIYKNSGGTNQSDLREQPGPLHRRASGNSGMLTRGIRPCIGPKT